MAELPKSVTRRLDTPQPGEHPDANLLAAFSEQALTGRERERVLAHLAACSECREVVSLALPEDSAQQPVMVFTPWYRRPATYAWSALLATFVVGAALVVNYDPLRSRNTPKYAEEEKLPEPAASQPQRDQGYASSAVPPAQKADGIAADKARRSQTSDALASSAPRRKSAETKKEVARNEARPAGNVPNPDMAALSVKQTAAAPAAPPAPEAQVAQQRAMRAEEGGKDAAAQAAPLLKPQPSGGHAASGAIAARVDSMQAAENVSAARVAKVAAISRWTVSGDGRLQRSSDGGRTWNEVAVAKDARFRAVAVVGNDVWTGGTALYHSADAGAHWTPQTLPGSSAEIASLSFKDVQHGSAQTADGVNWSTTDGGQHWTRQPQQ